MRLLCIKKQGLSFHRYYECQVDLKGELFDNLFMGKSTALLLFKATGQVQLCQLSRLVWLIQVHWANIPNLGVSRAGEPDHLSGLIC